MEPSSINWPRLKKDYLKWRDRLRLETQKILTSSEKVELSEYNHLGFFHKLDGYGFRIRRRKWYRLKKMPQEWISVGQYPGLWIAMFNPLNTFSRTIEETIWIMRFYFHPGYFIFDAQNPFHQSLFNKWLEKNENISDPWGELKNQEGRSLKERMMLHQYPYHKKFFEEHNFGAFIGYSDYICVVIVLEDSIQDIKFLTLKIGGG